MSESIWTPVVRHNVRVETLFSAFNGVFMALAIQASPMIAVSAVKASPIEVTMLVSAFPVGVFLGPVWAALGRGWGMRRLVTAMAIVGSLPLFALSWFETSWAFTLLVAFAQVMNSAMRMGQSSLYAVLYPRPVRGRVIGRFTFWTYLTMVPTIFIAGWCVGRNPSSFHILYPLAGACGLVGAWFYSGITLPSTSTIRSPGLSMRAAVQGVWKALGKDRAYRVFQIAYFLSGASFFMSTHVILLLATSELQFRPLELAISLTLIPQLVLAVSSPLWGHIYDRIGILNCRVLISVLSLIHI
ncbi:MAG: MFS transporter, partial [Gemmataceae bacterium]|nr:MFS transporter [Gemmataceae bacterium]